MKRSIQILFILCFCFTLGLKAQITKIDTYSNKIKGLTTSQKDDLELLFFGTVPKIFISQEEKPIILWAEKGPVSAIELNYKQIAALKNGNLSNSFKSVEVISLAVEKSKSFTFDDSYLTYFPNLKYLLINCKGELSIDEVKILLGNLKSSSSVSKDIEVIINETRTSS